MAVLQHITIEVTRYQTDGKQANLSIRVVGYDRVAFSPGSVPLCWIEVALVPSNIRYWPTKCALFILKRNIKYKWKCQKR